MTTPTDLLNAELRADGARPFLTFYDDSTGERVELSVATTANWVAKTANYLEEHGVEEGIVVSVRLPLHWQTAIIILATWAAGGIVSFSADGDLSFAGEEDAGGDCHVLTFEPMGADFSRLVATQPDQFVPTAPTGDDVLAATATDLPHGARVLTTIGYDVPGGLGYALIGPLAVSGSAVLVRHPDPARLSAHAEAERVSHTLGVTVPGYPRLD
ncbi:MAG TPA: TIGR03089 family protein [Mycobacteriales bacterium]|nr:TIGR03089 family protein [Mycobacteriales bacterium]